MCEKEIDVKGGITPEKVIRILEKHGTIVTLDEARLILEFMRKLARITVNQFLRSPNPQSLDNDISV